MPGSRLTRRLGARPKPSLWRLRQALVAYNHIVGSSPLAGWKPKEKELRRVSRLLKFDLVEMAQIIDSSQKSWGKICVSKKPERNPINATIAYLRNQKTGPSPMVTQSMILATKEHLDAAIETGDLDFFSRLGREIYKQERSSPSEELKIDKSKLFFVLHWQPRLYSKTKNGRTITVLWPGLAYMTNPARMSVWQILNKRKTIATDKNRDWGFIKIWQRSLALRPAQRALVRKVSLDGNSISFA